MGRSLRTCRQQARPAWRGMPYSKLGKPLCGSHSYSGLSQASLASVISWVRHPSSPVCFLTGHMTASKNHNQEAGWEWRRELMLTGLPASQYCLFPILPYGPQLPGPSLEMSAPLPLCDTQTWLEGRRGEAPLLLPHPPCPGTALCPRVNPMGTSKEIPHCSPGNRRKKHT